MSFSGHSFQEMDVLASSSYRHPYVSFFHYEDYSVKVTVDYAVFDCCAGYAFE
jgi:hypothetical protein